MRKIAVKDSNIIFDLFEINLINEFLNLDLEIYITDFVYMEIENQEQRVLIEGFINKSAIKVLQTTDKEIIKLYELQAIAKGLSIEDCSVYFHADKLDAMILTGDNKLRKFAESNEKEVHGILWIFDELVSAEIIIKGIAFEKLEQLTKINKRLPGNEYQKRLKLWKKY
jgi:rRNA-processing protein FCF1